jgi:hypothetical protein
VRLSVDPKGFIRSLEVLENDRGPTRETSQREQIISRLAVLKAAARFGASRPDCKWGDVLCIADTWLAWVQR